MPFDLRPAVTDRGNSDPAQPCCRGLRPRADASRPTIRGHRPRQLRTCAILLPRSATAAEQPSRVSLEQLTENCSSVAVKPERKHLKRLSRVIPRCPVYFITVVQSTRSPVLGTFEFQSICEEVWRNSETLYRWSVGPYVIMPDHVHFLCRESGESAASLSTFVGKWKQWTAKYAAKRLGLSIPLWQPEFFDHLLRSGESPGKTADYLWYNPVRAKLIQEPKDWPYRGNPGGW